jgi:hypothetical protein
VDFFKVEEDQAVDSIDPQDPFLDPCVHGALGDLELLSDFSYSFRGIWFVGDTSSCPGQLTYTGCSKNWQWTTTIGRAHGQANTRAVVFNGVRRID